MKFDKNNNYIVQSKRSTGYTQMGQRMHQNTPFKTKNQKKFCPLPTLPPIVRGHPLSIHHPIFVLRLFSNLLLNLFTVLLSMSS